MMRAIFKPVRQAGLYGGQIWQEFHKKKPL